MQFFDVTEGLQDHQINSAFHQGGNLLAERFAGFFKRSLAQGLDANTQWTYRPSDPGIETLRRIVGNARSLQVDFVHMVSQAVPRQPKGISAKCVGLNDLSAGLEIFVVNSANQVRLRQIQLVIATVDEDPFAIEKRPHGAITEQGRLLQTGKEVVSHSFENTR